MSGKGVGFERIRRITGYLAQDVSRMNDSKKAEVAERVKHASVNIKEDDGNDTSKLNKLQVR